MIEQELKKYIDPKKAEFFPYFFKTGEGGYAADDKFIGVTVPNQRKVAKKYFKTIAFKDISRLLRSDIHEYRLTALFILTYKFEKTKSELDRIEIVEFYIDHIDCVNNWDLVDASCYKILGTYLLDKDRSILYKFAKSGNLWKERISIVSTMAFIKQNDYEDTLKISEILLPHKHDLIHKAVGWMLREVGKNNESALVNYLAKHYNSMPRTMLRYSIERFNQKVRQSYLSGTV